MDEWYDELDHAFCMAINATAPTEALEELAWSILNYP